ncbi:MAG: hypothetical protein KG029_12620 [Bacteroidetes bacterium]|nr:hypothetical protein [Bacteroidota bacterium]
MWFRKLRLNRLIKARMTGNISAEQEAKLNKMLQESDAEEKEYLRMQELKQQLESIGPANENIDVSVRVMQKISAVNHAENQKTHNFDVFNSYFNPLPARFAFVMIIGIIIGAGLTWMVTTNTGSMNSEMLSGSLSSSAKQGISYSSHNTTIKLVPYQIENLHYLNFIVDTRNETNFEVFFNQSDFIMKKSDYVTSQGNQSLSFNSGSVVFTANGITSFQIILEKVHRSQASVTVKTTQNQNNLITRQINFD